jgi:tol-pal system protein YbgF
VTSRSGRGRRIALAAVAVLVAGCAVEPASPLLRDDIDRLRGEVQRLQQEVQGSRSTLLSELQAADRRTAQSLTELQGTLDRLSTRLDQLGREAGQVQGQLDELRRRVDLLALQFDVAPPSAGAPAAAPPPAPGSRGSAPGNPSAARPPGGGGAPGAPRPPPPGVPPAELYQTAYLDFTRGNYDLAIAAFQEFIRLHPTSELAEKAQFWIGESHFSLARGHQNRGERDQARQRLEQAVQEFQKLVVTHPRGERVPTALYKEALALAELGRRQLAEARLQFLLDQFPSTEEAAKAKDELARLRKR